MYKKIWNKKLKMYFGQKFIEFKNMFRIFKFRIFIYTLILFKIIFVILKGHFCHFE